MFNYEIACKSGWCPEPGDMEPIIPEITGILYPWQLYSSR